MATLITGTLAISGAKSYLDDRLLVIDDADCDCVDDPDCPARRARDFFVDSGTPSGATVIVCCDVTGTPPNQVLHMFRDNSECE